MLIYKSLLCYLYVNSIYGLTLYQINNRLSYIEDRINAESKFRRDDFGSLYNEISSIKEMLKQLMESNSYGKETKHTDEVKEHTSKELEEKIHRLSIGFKEEKMTNSRIRRKTHELQRQVRDLRTIRDKTSEVLADILKGIEHITKKTEVYQNDSNQLQSAFAKFEFFSHNFTKQYENKKNIEEQKLDKIMAGTNSIQENTEQLNEAQIKCFDNIEYIYNATYRLEQKINYVKHFVIGKTFYSCMDLYNNDVKLTGIYHIDVGLEKPLSVYCDMDTDDGGWTVFQRRKDGSVDFFRDWEDYKTGFGDLNGEFWLGNHYLNLLTDDDKQHELRIDLEDFDGNRAYAKYSSFKILPEEMKYKLEVGGYTGNAGNSLEASNYNGHIHDGMEFSTKDNDNDNSSGNCALGFKGAWWFNDCFASHLNGLYSQKATCTQTYKCIIWSSWKGFQTSIKFTEMKLR